ncbi:MAG: hypothetical protein LQ348_001639 [Seirophora lacunosa]|nr:MAG: hypothetical protein LQ348_001639 [Seirophora lacunosa]
MIEAQHTASLVLPSQLLVLSGPTLLLLCCLFFLKNYLFDQSKPRKLQDHYVAGLDNGRRTLAEARKHMVSNCAEMMLEGYERSPTKFFWLPTPGGDRLNIPTKYIEELKNAPDDRANFSDSFLEMFLGQYTTIGFKWHLHPNVIKKDLNAALTKIMPAVEEEIECAFDAVMPPCDDWTPLKMADNFNQLISRASNYMLGGTALSRNEEWTKTSIDFTTDTHLAAVRLKQIPAILRPFAQHIIPEMRNVRKHQDVARRVIIPVIESRLREGERPLDLLQMLWDAAKGPDKTPDFMAYTALAISFAAIRTSSSVPAHVLYDLCAHRQYIKPLRDECAMIQAEEGSLSTKSALNKLVKMDSFMKESQRFNPLTFRKPFLSRALDLSTTDSLFYSVTFGRVIHHDLTLSSGITIPAHTTIGVPAYATAHDPEFYPNPSRFDGFRFLASAGNSTGDAPQQQPVFTTTNASNLMWGYGKHACSGRFFATNEIKLILAHFLLRYDFMFKAGEGRPKNWPYELQNMADPTVEVLVRKR